MYMLKGQKQVNVDEITHDRLKHISKVTNVPMARLVSEWIEELFSLSVDCDHAYYKVESSILGHEVRCVLIGYDRKIQFGTCKTEFDLTQITTDKINADLLKKSRGLDL
jgi:hypothetical protein